MTSSNLEFPLHPSLNGVTSVKNGTINEYLIEQYVRYPEALDGATLEAVSARVESYRRESSIEQFYRQFYKEYDKLEGKISSSVNAFVSSLFE